jgi:hypothetical protein
VKTSHFTDVTLELGVLKVGKFPVFSVKKPGDFNDST